MQLRFATMVLGALWALTGNGLAAVPQVPPPGAGAASPTAPWSISGISLGMSPTQVVASMKAAGYRLDYRYMGRSWQGELASQVSFLRGIHIAAGAQVIRKEDYKKGQESIEVTYAVNPS